MQSSRLRAVSRALLAVVTAASLGSCATLPFQSSMATDEHECMARVMYFESNRSSDDGMLAVGTVVMNRLESGKYPRSVCGVVGQPGQFAAGALTSPILEPGRARAERIAAAVLSGQRHPGMDGVMFFHTAGLHFPYHNMHYVLVAGGNAFYEKVSTTERSAPAENTEPAGLIAPAPPEPPPRPEPDFLSVY
ncbi:MAG: cell wall hydrolase [Methylobacteriaceae bacterium]|nr:cell wall hydrolase [Methylobacteriaceae bacterium]